MSGPPVYPIMKKVQGVIPRDGLVGEYLANDNFLDTSGNGNNGVNSNVTFGNDRHGNPDSAFVFNGSTAYITLPLQMGLDMAQDDKFTWSLWINHAGGSIQIIIALTDSNGFGDNNGVAEFDISVPLLADWTVYGTIYKIQDSIPSGWVYLAGNKNGSDVEFYINGSLAGSIGSVPSVSSYNPLSFRIGRPHTNVRHFNGSIDDVLIYDRSLSSSEIMGIYNSQK